MTHGKITIGNVCFLIDRDKNEILFLERFFEPMKGLFSGVGGKTKFEEDIHYSCLREIKEETGLDATNLKLKGIIKTVLSGHDSSWILFVYTSTEFAGQPIDCPEGKLQWVGIKHIYQLNLIGFIREIMPFVLDEDSMIEGTIVHDSAGEVLSKKLMVVR